MSIERRVSGDPPLVGLELQAAMPVLIFWQQCLALVFCGGVAFRVYMPAVGCALLTPSADVAACVGRSGRRRLNV